MGLSDFRPYHVSIEFQKTTFVKALKELKPLPTEWGILLKYVLLVGSFKTSKLVRICGLVI